MDPKCRFWKARDSGLDSRGSCYGHRTENCRFFSREKSDSYIVKSIRMMEQEGMFIELVVQAEVWNNEKSSDLGKYLERYTVDDDAVLFVLVDRSYHRDVVQTRFSEIAHHCVRSVDLKPSNRLSWYKIFVRRDRISWLNISFQAVFFFEAVTDGLVGRTSLVSLELICFFLEKWRNFLTLPNSLIDSFVWMHLDLKQTGLVKQDPEQRFSMRVELGDLDSVRWRLR